MKEIKLIKLSYWNFKGAKKRTIDFGGRDTIISGANETGKTTVYDAFLWLLFGKDSSGAADFDFKPLDEDGSEIHNIETGVEAVMQIDGAEHTLKRISTEKWSRPRGQSKHVYGGNTTTFWVDEVPKTMAEHKAYVDNLVSEDIFRLITNHTAFNAMKTADRRAALIAISGVDVEDKLAAEFPDAAKVLNGGKPEDAKKRLREMRKRLNVELDAIPARIDELARFAPDAKAKRDAEHNIKGYNESLTLVDDMITARRASDPAEAAKARMSALHREIDVMERAAKADHDRALRAASDELQRLDRDRDCAAERVEDLEKRIRRAEADIAEKTKDVDWMRDEWKKEAETQPDEIDTVCPTCNQTLPEEVLEDAQRVAQERFETAKRRRLDEIAARAKRIKASLAVDQQGAEQLEVDLKHWQAQAEQISIAADAAQAALDAIPPVKLPPEHAALVSEIESLKSTPAGEIPRDLTERRDELVASIERSRAILAEARAAEAAQERIGDLEGEQRSLGDKLTEVDRQLIMVERYVSARCRLLEEGINALFPTVRWRLFNLLDNGGIEDACDCLIPSGSGAMTNYHKSTNTGAKINAGLEIIDVLCTFYGVAAPIFCDNMESVNEPRKTMGQQILLVVTKDKALKIKEAI